MPRPPPPLSQPGVEKKSGHHCQISKDKQNELAGVFAVLHRSDLSFSLPLIRSADTSLMSEELIG